MPSASESDVGVNGESGVSLIFIVFKILDMCSRIITLVQLVVITNRVRLNQYSFCCRHIRIFTFSRGLKLFLYSD